MNNLSNTDIKSEIKVGLALGAGFFRGLAHIGVLQAFEAHGIPIHMIAGTSMGSVIGAMYSTGMSAGMIERLTYSCNERMFYDIRRDRNGFVKGDKINSFIKTVTGDKDFSQTRIPFAAVACDIERGEKLVITEGKIYEAVRASISVPGIFVPAKIGDRVLVDGGVLERVPSGAARDLGADVVIAVDVGAREGYFEVDGLMDIMLRTVELMQFAMIASDGSADVIIAPDVRHIDRIKMAQSEECVAIGRETAEQMMPAIKEAIEKAASR